MTISLYLNISICQYTNISIQQYSTISIYQYVRISIYNGSQQDPNKSLYQYSIIQCIFASLFHESMLQGTSASKNQCSMNACKTFTVEHPTTQHKIIAIYSSYILHQHIKIATHQYTNILIVHHPATSQYINLQMKIATHQYTNILIVHHPATSQYINRSIYQHKHICIFHHWFNESWINDSINQSIHATKHH